MAHYAYVPVTMREEKNWPVRICQHWFPGLSLKQREEQKIQQRYDQPVQNEKKSKERQKWNSQRNRDREHWLQHERGKEFLKVDVKVQFETQNDLNFE